MTTTHLADAALRHLAIQVNPSVRREIDFALEAAAWATCLRRVALIIRPKDNDARLGLRAQLCKELRASKNDNAAKTIQELDNSDDDLLVVALNGDEARFCLLEIGELRATRAGRRAPSVAPARHGGAL